MLAKSSKSHYAKYLTTLLAWLLLFLVILELVVRSFFIHFPSQHAVPYLGVVPVDNSKAVWGVEGYGVTSYTLNGEVYTPFETDGKSIVVLGDSYTEALQVSDEKKFVSVTEQILHDNGKDVDLHNLGTSGRSAADYVYIAPRVIDLYTPKIVVIQVTYDDFIESFSPARPNYFVESGDHVNFVHNMDYFTFDLRWQNLARSSGLGSMAIYKLTPLVKDLRSRLAVKSANAAPILQTETDAEEDLWDVRHVVDMLEAAYDGTDVVFLIIPVASSVVDGNLQYVSEDEARFVEAVRESADQPVLYPSTVFSELYDKYQRFPRGFNNTLPNIGHLNVDGNRALGIALADYLTGLIK